MIAFASSLANGKPLEFHSDYFGVEGQGRGPVIPPVCQASAGHEP